MRQEVFNAQSLCRKDAIEGGERKLALAMKEIGNMRRLKPRLLGEKSAGDQSTIDSASDLDTETLMELGGIHLWIFVFELNISTGEFAHRKAVWAYFTEFQR